jgi:hypothetical protein
MVGVLGIEPRTSSLSGTRSNQLSYTPEVVAPRGTAIARSATGGGNRVRTGDLMLAKHVLYQLSYAPSPHHTKPLDISNNPFSLTFEPETV